MVKIFFWILFSLFAVSCQLAPVDLENKAMNIKTVDIITAVSNNNINLVEKALKEGIDVNQSDELGRSLLLIATIHRLNDLSKILVEYGADVNQQAQNHDSPFLFAGASGQTELLELFLKNGARFDIYNRYYGTALIPACERGYVSTVQLLANTPDFPINHVNKLGWTALMETVILGDGSDHYIEIVRILLEAGADKTIPDLEGVTVLEHARKKGFDEIIKLLTQ